MAVLDGAILNVALPVIANKLGTSPASSVWIINAYQLTITILLLPVAAMADRIGHRPIYLGGLGFFLLGSLVCALSSSFEVLVAGRVIQGAGAACIMSLNAALLRTIYPSAQLGRGIGYNALVLSLSSAAGPTFAALILGIAPWPWLFFANMPFGIAALAIAVWALPRGSGHGKPFDWTSALLSAATMGLIVFGAETMTRDSARTGALLVTLAVAAGALLIRREWSQTAPLVPLDLMRIPILGLSIATSIVSFGAQMIAFVALPFLLQSELRLNILETGMMMTAWPLAVVVVAPIAGRLADNHPAGLLGGIGLAIFAFGLVLVAQIGTGSSLPGIGWRIAVCGMGFGFFQSPNNRTIIGSAPRERSGAAGGLLATARLLGQTWGAVTVASSFRLGGVASAPLLFRGASVAAALGAAISLLRLSIRRPIPQQA